MTTSPRAVGELTTPGAPGALIYVRDGDSEATIRRCLAELELGVPSFITGGIDDWHDIPTSAMRSSSFARSM